MSLSQNCTPIASALVAYRKNRTVRFDVPGHKGGRGNHELRDFFGKHTIELDVNSSKFVDNLCQPSGVIKEAEILAANAFGSLAAFFMVNGTTSSVQAMIMAACKPGDKIILPRNVHKSVINILIVTGVVPVYINPGIDKELGVSLNLNVDEVISVVKENLDAKAILVNNPTYYGFCSDLRAIVKVAHDHNILVLADEAHGTHFYFGKNTPVSALEAGADMAAVSLHKTGGSLTQSSILLTNFDPVYVRQVINLTQTTSASYILLASLDIARKNLSLNGEKNVAKAEGFAKYAREEIESIGTYRVFDRSLINGKNVFDFDLTKFCVNTSGIGLAGIEVYDILREKYNIQIEFGDIGNILAIMSHADRFLEIERLIGALCEIKRMCCGERKSISLHNYVIPHLEITPREAFYSSKISMSIDSSSGRISGESVTCYPPGIPILAPGELVTKEVIDAIKHAKSKGCLIIGTSDPDVEHLMVIEDTK